MVHVLCLCVNDDDLVEKADTMLLSWLQLTSAMMPRTAVKAEVDGLMLRCWKRSLWGGKGTTIYVK